MMTEGGNADGKRSEKGEEEDVLKTVECLRGRLLAERAASRSAKDEADQLGNKLIELETRLKEETKSRNRAERRLKSLMKKLESLEIFYVSDESERSSFVEKSEISSASSVASTSTKEAEDHKQVNANPNVVTQNVQELTVEYPPIKSSSFIHAVDSRSKNVSQSSVSSSQTFGTPAGEEVLHRSPETAAQNFETAEISSLKTLSPEEYPRSPTAKETSSSLIEAHIAKSSVVASSATQNYQELKIDSHSFGCTIKEDVLNGEEVEQDDNVDNSLALVTVDLPQTEQRIDPVVLDATVKEVLDALRHAKEKLQTSMERRRGMIIKVG